MDTMFLFLLGVLVTQTIAQSEEPEPGNCVYTINIPTSALRGSCMTERFQLEMEEMRAEFNRISTENEELRTSLEKVVKDYGEMVDSVRTLKEDTASWKAVVQWPTHDELFNPNDLNAKPVSSEKYVDCYQAHNRDQKKKQGIYLLAPANTQNPFYGYCIDDGWTVIFRRFDGSVDFNRFFHEYSMGFGNITGELFIGLENIHLMTANKPYELKVEALGYNKKRYTAMYPKFRVEEESDQYRLVVSNMTSGDFNDEDDFSLSNGLGFTANDRDNDLWDGSNCASHFQGGWWLTDCGSNPSAPYCEYYSCMSWGGINVERLVLSIRPYTASSSREPARRVPENKPRRRQNKATETDDN